MKSKRTNRFAHLIFIGPAFFFYTMFWIIPTLVAIWISFTRWNGISWAHIKWAGFANYFKLLNDRFFFTALQNNLLFVFCAVAIIFFTALAIALILNLKPFGWRMFQTTFFVPIVISSVVIGLLFKLFLSPTTGIINELADFLNLESFKNVQWLGSKETATYSVMTVYIWRDLGFSILLFGAGLQSVPKDLIEAAKIDGAGLFTVYWRILLPMMRPVFFTSFVILVHISIKSYDLIVALTQGGPGISTTMPALFMTQAAFHKSQVGLSAASAMMMFMAVAAVIIPYLYSELRRENAR